MPKTGISERLTPIQGAARIQTSLILTEVKSTTAVPVDRVDAKG